MAKLFWDSPTKGTFVRQSKIQERAIRQSALRQRQAHREQNGFYDKGLSLAVAMAHDRAGHRRRQIDDATGKLVRMK